MARKPPEVRGFEDALAAADSADGEFSVSGGAEEKVVGD